MARVSGLSQEMNEGNERMKKASWRRGGELVRERASRWRRKMRRKRRGRGHSGE